MEVSFFHNQHVGSHLNVSDTLHVSIEISGNGRLEQPPYADDFRNGIASITMFLTSTVTGLNLTISNGTFAGWSEDALDTPEFLCNSTTNDDFENAGCQEIMLRESGSTVKHVNWAWPDCLVGNGGADNGDCNSRGSVDDCLGGTARGPYNVSVVDDCQRPTDGKQISFHEAFRINGTDFYTITDLSIRVTNSIPETTDLAGSQVRPRCGLRNNPLIPFATRDASIRAPPSQPYTGILPEDMSNRGNASPGAGQLDDKPDQQGPRDPLNPNQPQDPLDPGSPGAGSLGGGFDGASSFVTVNLPLVVMGPVLTWYSLL